MRSPSSFWTRATCIPVTCLLLARIHSSLSSNPIGNEEERNSTAWLEKGHGKSNLMTWILGFVFVSVISLSSMIGLILIPTATGKKGRQKVVKQQGKRRESLRQAKETPTSYSSPLSSVHKSSTSSPSPPASPTSCVAVESESETAAASVTASSTSGDGEVAAGSFAFSTSYIHNGLEGLALGSLLASSIFHLIPHAFDLVGQDREHNYLFTSLLIFTGIYLFYWSEKVLILIADYRKGRQANKKKMTTSKQGNTRRGSIVTRVIATGSTVSSISCKDGQTVQLTEDSHFSREDVNPITDITTREAGQASLADSSSRSSPMSDSERGLKDVKSTRRLCCPQHHHHHENLGQNLINDDDDDDADAYDDDIIVNHKSAAREERKHHLAWMVIIGDGIHNLIDGLSLGAALSDSHVTGFSIAIAILFEEIPHELGDYVILISSGMSPRKAALCNFASASTCYLGLVIGIISSDLSTSSSNSLIFAVAAGMFLYISIFNVMTDLNENFKSCREISMSAAIEMLFWQNMGILVGVYILYSLAQFDEKLLLQSLRIEL